jgi:hypothetical protein
MKSSIGSINRLFDGRRSRLIVGRPSIIGRAASRALLNSVTAHKSSPATGLQVLLSRSLSHQADRQRGRIVGVAALSLIVEVNAVSRTTPAAATPDAAAVRLTESLRTHTRRKPESFRLGISVISSSIQSCMNHRLARGIVPSLERIIHCENRPFKWL